MDIPVNYLAILAAAVFAYAVGALWHSPAGFGRQWQKMMGFSEHHMKSMPLTAGQAMMIGFIVTLLVSYVFAHFVYIGALAMGAFSIQNALITGFWVWLGFLAPTVANGWLWEGKSVKLFFFNAAYQLVSIEAMALVLGWWQ